VATYRELKAQMAELEIQAAAARQREFGLVLDDIRAKVAEYGITARDIFGDRRAAASRSRSQLPAKYRDPGTGAMWSGRGRPPDWIKFATNRKRFLISS